VSWRKVKASRTQEPVADGADTLQRSGAVQSLFGMPHGGVFGGMFATPKMPPAPTSVVAGSGAASRVCVWVCGWPGSVWRVRVGCA
jgi:hypothetical protein